MKETKQKKQQRNSRANYKKTMRKSWEHLVLLGACSLALGASSALCLGHSETTASLRAPVAHAQHNALTLSNGHGVQSRQNKYTSQQHSLAQDLLTRQSNVAPMASSDFSGLYPVASPPSTSTGLTAQSNQPSVYHSIIDRTDGPSRRQASSAIQTSPVAAATDGDLHTAAGHHHGHAYGKYYEYRAVPKKKTWKFGYKRGNHKHTISRHEHGKAGKHPHFKTKVKWHDSKSKGKGIHLWDYNHHDKKHYHHHG